MFQARITLGFHREFTLPAVEDFREDVGKGSEEINSNLVEVTSNMYDNQNEIDAENRKLKACAV